MPLYLASILPGRAHDFNDVIDLRILEGSGQALHHPRFSLLSVPLLLARPLLLQVHPRIDQQSDKRGTRD